MSVAEGHGDNGCRRQCGACTRLRLLLEGSAELHRFKGWPLVLMSLLTFLLPVACALAGAWAMPAAWPHAAAGLVGAVAGLVLGALTAMVLVAAVRLASKNK